MEEDQDFFDNIYKVLVYCAESDYDPKEKLIRYQLYRRKIMKSGIKELIETKQKRWFIENMTESLVLGDSMRELLEMALVSPQSAIKVVNMIQIKQSH